MSLSYIRGYYGVPAKRGARVTWRGAPGKILSSLDGRIRVLLDARPHGACVILHPTDADLVYLEAEGGPK